MKKHIVLLGDLKGTKSYLKRYIGKESDEIVNYIESLQSCFSRVALEFLTRSRSMTAYTFSDSVFVRWDDFIEGKRIAPEFAIRFWQLIQATNLKVRIYIDEGFVVPERNDLGPAIEVATGRFHQIFPISTAVWSVFLAENSHFSDGIFVGNKLVYTTALMKYKFEETIFEAGPFTFRKISLL